MEIRITALIGLSGCGKSTFIGTFNRIHEELKKRVGMVFQKPNSFSKSIYKV